MNIVVVKDGEFLSDITQLSTIHGTVFFDNTTNLLGIKNFK